MRKGFTLIEVMIVVALSAVMLVVLAEFFFGTSQTYRTQSADLGVNFTARTALDDVDVYVRQATRTVATYGAYTAGPTTLILEVQSVNSSNQLVPGTYDTVVFYLSGTQLMREIIPGAGSTRLAGTRSVGDDITNLRFLLNNGDYAQVTEVTTDLTILINTGRETRDLTIDSKSRLRN